MTFTTFGRERMALGLGSAIPNNQIIAFGIGNGSTAESNADIALDNEILRFNITGSPNFTESRKVTFTGDINSVQLSGLTLAEFGLFNTGSNTGYTGSTYLREVLAGSIVGDGTIEVRFEQSVEVM